MATVFIRWGQLDPLWPSCYFSEIWPQRVKSLWLRVCLWVSRVNLGGWGSKFGTADISKIRNFEYWNNESRVIRFFCYRINSLFLWLFKLFEHSKYIFDNSPSNSKFFEFWVLQIVKLKKFANFWNSTIWELWLFFCQ